MKYLFLLLLITSCVTSQNDADYKKHLVKDQLPYVLADYELKGDVVAMQLSHLNNSQNAKQLDKFDTERYQFKDGYLLGITKEKLSGGRYEIKETEVEYDAAKPLQVTTTRNGLPFEKNAITYDSNGRMKTKSNDMFTTTFEYDSDSRLIKHTDVETKTGKERNIWTFEYKSDELYKKSLSITDRTSGKMKKSSYRMYKNGGIIKDVTIKNGEEEVYLENELDQHGNVIKTKNKYDKTETFEYIYDDHNNWIVQMHTTSYGKIYVKHRTIEYADGTTTGEQYNDASKIATIKSLTHDPQQHKKYIDKLETLRK